MPPSHQFDFLKNLPPPGEPQFWEISPGRRLAWNEYGDPAGRPVMYYHGWPSSRLQAVLAHHLAKDRGIRIIAMDRPGMGRSTFEAGRKLDAWPGMIERFADALGIGKFGQLGISGGGPYVLACAAAIPDRLTRSAVLAGAVLMDDTPGGLRGLHPAYRMLAPVRKLPGPLFTPIFGLAGRLSRLNLAKPPMSWALHTLASEDRKLLLGFPGLQEVLTRSFREAFCQSGGRGVMTDAAIYFQQLAVNPAEIQHPVRYWHGGEDRNIPLAMVRRFAANIAGAELIVDEKLGHFSLVIQRAADAMDYLATKAVD